MYKLFAIAMVVVAAEAFNYGWNSWYPGVYYSGVSKGKWRPLVFRSVPLWENKWGGYGGRLYGHGVVYNGVFEGYGKGGTGYGYRNLAFGNWKGVPNLWGNWGPWNGGKWGSWNGGNWGLGSGLWWGGKGGYSGGYSLGGPVWGGNVGGVVVPVWKGAYPGFGYGNVGYGYGVVGKKGY